jgi:hypothetical protein
MATGKKLAHSFVRRMVEFDTSAKNMKDTRGIKAPGGKPGSYHGCNTLPSPKFDNKGMLVSQRKGTPSATMARLRALAKAKGGEHGHAGFR